jgi:hypothetical protein
MPEHLLHIVTSRGMSLDLVLRRIANKQVQSLHQVS